MGGDKSEAIFAATLLRGYFCREATIYLYRATGNEMENHQTLGSGIESGSGVKIFYQKPGDHPDFKRNALGVKKAILGALGELRVFSEQLLEFRKQFSE